MMFIELSKRDVAKGANLRECFAEDSNALLTFRAARIVLAGSKFVLDHGVADHQLEILWNFDEFVLRRAAIQQKRMCRAPKAGNKLVHDSHARADKFVLCFLAQLSQFRAVDGKPALA